MPRPAGPFRGAPQRRSRALLPTLIVLGALIAAYVLVVTFWTDRLWYQSVDFTQVFTTQLVTRIGLFLVFGLLMAASVVVNGMVAYRVRPRYRPMSVEQQSLDRYRDAIDPVRTWVLTAAAVLLAIMAGASAAGQWQTFLLWRNGGEFGQKDAQFGLDLGFFAFDYPWWRYLVSFGFAVVVLGLVVAAITHYVYGGIRLQTAGQKVSPATTAHLSVLIGLFVLLKAVAYWLDRYALVMQDNDRFTGGSYTDINAVLPAKTILIFVATICAILFFVNVWQRNWTLPGIGLGLLVLSAVLLGGLWPFLVQQFQVRPSEASREAPYISRNIEATRDAYGIQDVQTEEYRAETSVQEGQLAQDSATIPGIRLMDPSVIPPAFQQLQQVRGFYTFSDPLDVDRYTVEGDDGVVAEQDMVVAVREVNSDGIPSEQRNWINEHTVYTHGFGVVAAYGNTRESDGSPNFAEEDIPTQGVLGEYEPRIYFGENSPSYSIVGAPEGTDPVEYDIPEDPETGSERRNTYTGDGGVPIGSFWNKLLYATRFQEANFLLSDRLNSESRLLYERNPRDRVEKVAPWLTVDANPFPSVVDGRVVWVLDGYTTLNSLPYSQRVSLSEATSDSRTARPALAAQPDDFINYVRNSVKATVDAYDGTVTLYAWDEDDPVLQAWMNAFPDSVQPRSEIPTPLLDHLRYPEDLFKLQRNMLEQYHVTEASTFYGGQDRWVVPADPSSNVDVKQPPYYQTIQLPDADEPIFSLTTTYTPRGRPNLAAFMAVNADARSDDYGQLQILRLPSNTQIDGPGQVANDFESNADVAQQLTLLRSGDAETQLGNLLTLPVGGGLLYVQPVYVARATGEAAYPLLRRVLVQFGDSIGFDDTLQGALDQIFEGDSGTVTGDEPPIVEETPPPGGEETPPPDTETTPPPTTEQPADLTAALDAIRVAWQEARDAQAAGDWAEYGAALQRLDAAIAAAEALTGGEGAGGATPGATPGQ
ncbi:UPF0182 family protein [Jiangella alba]|uniref:UPF0182 protein SAMN04488561_6115 n=1 Tax=Jiangella alba TaxID=561176 RepID=A0A1H5PVZ7_9ACTN|nr:UPF0182 family protein [Jiangella alba]SEF17915.1 hypothetical protein SAMN04488561_6115 [Jiangella alba]